MRHWQEAPGCFSGRWELFVGKALSYSSRLRLALIKLRIGMPA